MEANAGLNKPGLASCRCRAAALLSLSRPVMVATGRGVPGGRRAVPLLLAGRGGKEVQSCAAFLQRLEEV
jgi:hypothetical protein